MTKILGKILFCLLLVGAFFPRLGVFLLSTDIVLALGNLDQQMNTDDDGAYCDRISSVKCGQSISSTVAADIESFTFRLYRDAALSGYVWGEFWSDSGGTPGVKLATSTNWFDVSTFGVGHPNGAEYNFTFATGTTMEVNGTYWLVINGDWTPDGTGLGQGQHNAGYSSGDYAVYDGANWSVPRTGYDNYFKEYWTTSTPDEETSSTTSTVFFTASFTDFYNRYQTAILWLGIALLSTSLVLAVYKTGKAVLLYFRQNV